MQYLWLWFVADYVFLMLSGGKRQHYLLPLIPAMSILTAILIDEMAFVRQVFTPKYAANILRGHVLFFVVVSIAVPVYFAKAKIPELASATAWVYVISFSVILIVTTIVVAILFVKRYSSIACVALFCGITVLMAHHYTGLLNILSPDQAVKQFALKVAEMMPTTDKMVSYGTVPSNFIHYFGRTVVKVQDDSELNNLYQQNYWVVSFGKEMDELLNTGRYKLVYMDTEHQEAQGRKYLPGDYFTGSCQQSKAQNNHPCNDIFWAYYKNIHPIHQAALLYDFKSPPRRSRHRNYIAEPKESRPISAK